MGHPGRHSTIKRYRSIAKVTNPVIQTDIAEILKEISSNQKKLLEEVNELKLGQAEIKGDIKANDEKLLGKIKTLDEKVSGQKEVVEKITVQLDKRISNQELLNRVIGGSLVVSIIGGILSFFWMLTQK